MKGSHGVPPDDETHISENYDEYKEDKPADSDNAGDEERSPDTPVGNSLKDIFEGLDDYPVGSNEALVLDKLAEGIEERAEATNDPMGTETQADIFAGIDDYYPDDSKLLDESKTDNESINAAKDMTRKLGSESKDPDRLVGVKSDSSIKSLPSSPVAKTNIKECPLQPPMEATRCRFFHICHYDKDDCCEPGYNHLKVICYYGQWMNQWSRVPCEKLCDEATSTYLPYQGLFGFPTATTTSRYYPLYQSGADNPYQGFGVTFPTTNPSQWSDPEYPGTSELSPSSCPENVPLSGERCWSENDECKYGTQVCCGKEYPEVYFLCSNGAWQEEKYQTPCASGTLFLNIED